MADQYVVQQVPQYLYWSNYQYQNNLEGIRSLMSDVHKDDPELFHAIDPYYKSLENNQTESNVITFVSLIAGGGLIIGGSASSGQPNDPTSVRNGPPFNMGLVVMGALVGVGGAALAATKRVNHNDILNFSNQFNRLSTYEQLYLSVHPAVDLGPVKFAGVNFKMVF